eukprot:TRINITY_DN72_c1_g1_i1.p7 TRINITY_DN72_c1_g1~~TRINITY_DN72_c1_g1_i1.p7  ORF type:complete len:105 (-),score=6.97 TRINITY_DN72_c1_g1_i1:80-394(-)
MGGRNQRGTPGTAGGEGGAGGGCGARCNAKKITTYGPHTAIAFPSPPQPSVISHPCVVNNASRAALPDAENLEPPPWKVTPDCTVSTDHAFSIASYVADGSVTP